MLNKNITIKILSVVLAFVLWLYVMGEKNPEITVDIGNIPVNIVNVNTLEKKGLTLIDNKNYTVTVKVRGRRSDIMGIRSSDIQVQADLSRVTTKGTNVIPVEISSIPKNITFVSANPSEIKIDIDNIAKVQMPVSVKVSGNVADGYAMKPAISTPGEVVISGPESKINLVKNVIAQVNMSNKTKDVKISVPAVAVDRDNNEVKGINIDPKFVDVGIAVNRAIRVPVNAKIFGKPQNGYDIAAVNVLPEYVYVTGEDAVLNGIKNINTKQIDITGLNHSLTQNVQFDLPQGVSLVKDSTAKVYIDIQKIITKDITLTNIEVKDTNNRNVTLNNSSITISVEGLESVVNNTTADNFNASIDISNLSSGKQNANVNVTTDLNLKITKISSNTLSVNIP